MPSNLTYLWQMGTNLVDWLTSSAASFASLLWDCNFSTLEVASIRSRFGNKDMVPKWWWDVFGVLSETQSHLQAPSRVHRLWRPSHACSVQCLCLKAPLLFCSFLFPGGRKPSVLFPKDMESSPSIYIGYHWSFPSPFLCKVCDHIIAPLLTPLTNLTFESNWGIVRSS